MLKAKKSPAACANARRGVKGVQYVMSRTDTIALIWCLAGAEGLEPKTRGFGDRRSTS